jgi:hypothetical protein
MNKVLLLLNNIWHCGSKQFTVSKAQKLTGKLGYLAQGATWIFHLLSHLYASIVYALSENKSFILESLRKFQDIVNSLKKGTYLGTNTNSTRHISFAMKLAAKLVHHAKYRYNISKITHQEIDFFRKKAPAFVMHHLGNTHCSHYTKNAHGNSLWGQLPGRCRRILD